MSGEIMPMHDEPVGGLAWRSKIDLADELIQQYLDYEHEAASIAPAEELIQPNNFAHSIGDFRLGTLSPPYRDVPPNRQSDGYAFCVAPHETDDPAYMAGMYFRVTRGDTPDVAESKSIFIARPNTLEGILAHREEVEELSRTLSKPELKVVKRILGKMTKSLRLARKVINLEDDPDEVHTGKSRPSRRSFDKLAMTADLNRLVSADPTIMYAVQNYNLSELSVLFPANRPLRSPAAEASVSANSENEHISEWPEFAAAIKTHFRRETDTNLAKSAIAIQHIVGEDHYVMRFQAQAGQLPKVQILCWGQDNRWRSQEFDLRVNDEEDDLERLKIKSEWNKTALLEAVEYGQPITNEVYKGYLELAASDPDSELSAGSIINITVNKKRPAA
ncbi:MAG TPA: hypothetical protein VFH99_04270 [Candidatus Saccharimonadales bacterium]|nr:hypothetical protein [Candidatus Saccharimonadales bacterium]